MSIHAKFESNLQVDLGSSVKAVHSTRKARSFANITGDGQCHSYEISGCLNSSDWSCNNYDLCFTVPQAPELAVW